MEHLVSCGLFQLVDDLWPCTSREAFQTGPSKIEPQDTNILGHLQRGQTTR